MSAPDSIKTYPGKRFVILLFLGFVLFAIVMGFGTWWIGHLAGGGKASPRPHRAAQP